MPRQSNSTEAPTPSAPPGDEIWTTRDGRRLLVGEMDEQHVRDALRMVLRNARRRRDALAQLDAMRKRLVEVYEVEQWVGEV